MDRQNKRELELKLISIINAIDVVSKALEKCKDDIGDDSFCTMYESVTNPLQALEVRYAKQIVTFNCGIQEQDIIVTDPEDTLDNVLRSRETSQEVSSAVEVVNNPRKRKRDEAGVSISVA